MVKLSHVEAKVVWDQQFASLDGVGGVRINLIDKAFCAARLSILTRPNAVLTRLLFVPLSQLQLVHPSIPTSQRAPVALPGPSPIGAIASWQLLTWKVNPGTLRIERPTVPHVPLGFIVPLCAKYMINQSNPLANAASRAGLSSCLDRVRGQVHAIARWNV